MQQQDSLRVIVSASSQDYPGWIGTQEDELNLVCREDWAAWFAPECIDRLLAARL